MAITTVTKTAILSDLLVSEVDSKSGYSREVVEVTSSAAKTLPMGSVVFRAKGIVPTADYAPLTGNGDLVDTNEFAIVFGDSLCAQPEVVLAAGVMQKCIAFVRGQVILKEWRIQDSLGIGTGSEVITAAQFETLRHLLKAQGVIVEKTCR